MSRFETNAEMSLRLLKSMRQKDGSPFTEEQENHFKNRYAPILDKMDNDFDDNLGLPRLTEQRDKK